MSRANTVTRQQIIDHLTSKATSFRKKADLDLIKKHCPVERMRLVCEAKKLEMEIEQLKRPEYKPNPHFVAVQFGRGTKFDEGPEDFVIARGYQPCSFKAECDECGKESIVFFRRTSVEYLEGDYHCLECAKKDIERRRNERKNN